MVLLLRSLDLDRQQAARPPQGHLTAKAEGGNATWEVCGEVREQRDDLGSDYLG